MTEAFKLPVVASLETTQAQLAANLTNTIKATEDLLAFGKGNLEALATSGQVWAAGAQDLGQSVATQAKVHMDETVAALKAFAGAKSLKELLDLQAAFVRSSVGKATQENTRLAEASRKLAVDSLGPIAARVTLAAGMLNRAA